MMTERKVRYLISESEGMIMEYLWNQEEGKTFGDITEYLNTTCQKEWKKQTINTFIRRLMEKGLIVSQNSLKRRVYYPSMSYTDYRQWEAKDFLSEFYGGSMKMFLSAFSGGGKLDEDTANELKEILGDM